MLDPRLVPHLGDVRLAAIRGACDGGLTRSDDGWHPGYACCDRRMPFNSHTITTLEAFGLLRIDGDTARGTRLAHEITEQREYLEAAE
jgi:hypothetical protein